jgi:glutamate racemase
VLATESTSRSERLARLIREHADGVKVLIEACPGWATRVETLHPLNAHDDPAFAAEVAARVLPLLDAGADRLVLGCTHYAFLTPLLTPLLAGRAELVDVAEAVARQVLRQAKPAPEQQGRLHLLATARPEQLHAALPALGLHSLLARCHGSAALLSA